MSVPRLWRRSPRSHPQQKGSSGPRRARQHFPQPRRPPEPTRGEAERPLVKPEPEPFLRLVHSARCTSGVLVYPPIPTSRRPSNHSLGNVGFEERARECKFVLVLLGIVIETEAIFCLQIVQEHRPPNSVPTAVTQFTLQLAYNCPNLSP